MDDEKTFVVMRPSFGKEEFNYWQDVASQPGQVQETGS